MNFMKLIKNTNKKSTQEIGTKILTPKEMDQRLPIALARVKAGKISENLLNEIKKVVILYAELKKELKNM